MPDGRTQVTADRVREVQSSGPRIMLLCPSGSTSWPSGRAGSTSGRPALSPQDVSAETPEALPGVYAVAVRHPVRGMTGYPGVVGWRLRSGRRLGQARHR
jgi:hypothetical protein